MSPTAGTHAMRDSLADRRSSSVCVHDSATCVFGCHAATSNIHRARGSGHAVSRKRPRRNGAISFRADGSADADVHSRRTFAAVTPTARSRDPSSGNSSAMGFARHSGKSGASAKMSSWRMRPSDSPTSRDVSSLLRRSRCSSSATTSDMPSPSALRASLSSPKSDTSALFFSSISRRSCALRPSRNSRSRLACPSNKLPRVVGRGRDGDFAFATRPDRRSVSEPWLSCDSAVGLFLVRNARPLFTTATSSIGSSTVAKTTSCARSPVSSRCVSGAFEAVALRKGGARAPTTSADTKSSSSDSSPPMTKRAVCPCRRPPHRCPQTQSAASGTSASGQRASSPPLLHSRAPSAPISQFERAAPRVRASMCSMWCREKAETSQTCSQ
eukprot:Opistho-1_new@62575